MRRRVVPIYQYPLLVLKGSTPGEYVEPDEAITDGDDNKWSGDRKLLNGNNGGWKKLVDGPKSVGSAVGEIAVSGSRQSKKRTHENVETEEQNHNTDSPKRRRHTKPPELIDLTMSSPVAIPERSPSIGFDYSSADEQEVN